MIGQRNSVVASWQTENHEYLLLSCHLYEKVKKLQFELDKLSIKHIQVNGKIYHRHKDVFTGIYFDLTDSRKLKLN